MADPPRSFRGAFARGGPRVRELGRASGPIRLTPSAVAAPRGPDDVALLVEWAREEGLALIPRGAGTGMPGGNVGPGVSLDLAALDGLEVDPASATARVGPGVVAADLDAAAREAGLFFPALPSSARWATLGGMAANNAAGARSFGYGTVRDWVDAAEVVLADGRRVVVERGAPLPEPLDGLRDALLEQVRPEALDAWPAVRKNASGYGLDRFLPDADGVALLTGSEGTLGVLTGLRLRLAPLPASRAVVLLALPSLDGLDPVASVAEAAGAAACEFMGRRFIEIAGLEDHPEVGSIARGAEALVLVELDDRRLPVAEGLERLETWARAEGLATTRARDEAHRARLWEIRHAASPVIARQAERGRVSMQFIEDAVVPRTALAAYLRGLERILHGEETDAVLFGHAGDGNVHVNPLVEVGRPDWRGRVRRILDATAELVTSLGGTLSGEHGDGRIRAPYLDAVWGEELAGAFRTVKDRLDPDGVLNPGVVLPLPGQDPLEGLSPEPRRR